MDPAAALPNPSAATPSAGVAGPPTLDVPAGAGLPTTARSGPAWWRWLRRGIEAAVAGAGIYAIFEARHQLAAGAGLLGHLAWPWVVAACAAELASMVAFARVQRWLLRAGGVPLGLVPMVEITFAGNALSVSLPGGVAWGAGYAFEQLRRRGANRILAVWVVLAAGALDALALFVLIVIGVWGAGATGPARDLRIPAAILAAIPVAIAAVYVVLRHSGWCRRVGSAAARAVQQRLPWGDAAGRLAKAAGRRLGAVQPRPADWAASFGIAMANWLYDGACLVCCMLALGIAIPWRGLLVAYCLAQIGASLPILPGGIGIVEASLSVALIAYGVHTSDAVAAVLLYRIISFWALVPIGWGAWGLLQLRGPRGDRSRHPWAWHAVRRQNGLCR
ncbi:MAG: lysylphosphatidylglycerol synthase transmembrane domain-containing protein [Acidimicrobiales bacterium]